jgi:predicted amidophosphoribosyltransferase
MTDTHPEPARVDESTSVKCAKCGYSNHTEDDRCSQCHASLYVLCGRCGRTNQRNLSYCKDCGERLHARFRHLRYLLAKLPVVSRGIRVLYGIIFLVFILIIYKVIILMANL